MADRHQTYDPTQWDAREDGSRKGTGFLGALVRPDGGVSSELSMGTSDVTGQELDIPLLVPTLSEAEVRHLLSAPPGQWDHPLMQSVVRKAIDFAKQRIAQGKSPFAAAGEGLSGLHPNLPRAYPEGADALVTSRGTAQPDDVARSIREHRERFGPSNGR